MPADDVVQPYEWALLRVVPRVERGELVNVGVLVYSRPFGYLGARLTTDLGRAAALDPDLDVDGVRRHLDSVRSLCQRGDRDRGERFRWLVAPRSTVVQPGPVHTGLTDDPDRELQDLFARMVDPPVHGDRG